MSIKEKLYKEYIINYNKVCELNGKEPLECNEEFFNSPRFQCEARTKSINEWRESISYQEYVYEHEVMRLKIENYFNTEEGKILKENTTKRLNEIYDARRKYIKETNKEIEQIIKSWLGEQWGIRLNGGNMEVGIVKEVRCNKDKDKWNDFHFGLKFDVYFYGEKENYENRLLKMNYGSMDSFNLLETDNLRSQFLLGMGMFSTNTEHLESLKKRLTEYYNMLYEWMKEVSNLEEKLANPLNIEKEVV